MAEEKKEYAIIRTGGKQYRVTAGDVIEVERLAAESGEKVEFNDVLFLTTSKGHQVGQPVIGECVVRGELVDEVRGPKVVAFKFKRRKNYRRKIGHRQNYSRVKITAIEGV